MNISAIAQIILIHVPTFALATTLLFLFRALRATLATRPQRAVLFTAEDTVTKWQNRTTIWENRVRLLRQLTSINAICLSACLVNLLFAYAFPPLWVAAFTIAYILILTPYLLRKIPVLIPALKNQLSR